MTFYAIDFVAHEMDVHPSSLRRWEDHGLISPERVAMGKTTLRIYDEQTMRVLHRAKELMDTGMSVSDAFGRARDENEEREERSND